MQASIDLGGLDIRDIAYLPQTVDIDRSFPISVFDFVGTGLWRSTGFFGGMGKAARDKIAQALAAVGLNGFENRSIGTLSGGQMQRMLFARVLLQDARLIVLDEPFNAIDAKTSADLLALVQALARRGAHRCWRRCTTWILVRSHFPETLLLARGPVAWGPTAQVLTRGKPRWWRGGCARPSTTAPPPAPWTPCRRGPPDHADHDALIAPFTEFEFMRRALAAVIALSLGGAPIGVFLMLRRMSLVGDAMAHAILPGAAIGFLLSGLNLFAMTTGGLIAGFAVALLAGVVARTTELKEDASLADLLSGVAGARRHHRLRSRAPISTCLHVLFGNILAMDDQTLLVIAFNATITLLVLAVIYRPLVIECVDPVFLRTVSRAGAPAHLAFLALVVINLVNGFHALGTLLGRRADDPARRHRAVLVARHHRHDLHRGRKRDRLRLCRAGAVVPDPHSLRACDHPGRGRALCGLAVVRQCQRAGAADVPRPSPRGVATMRRFLAHLSRVDRGRRPGARRGSPQRRRQLSRSSAISSAMSAVTASMSTTLVGPDSDAHVYVPTPSDAKKIAGCEARVRQRSRLRGLAAAAGASPPAARRPSSPRQPASRRSSSARMPIRTPGNPSPMRRSMSPISAMRWQRGRSCGRRSLQVQCANAYLADLDALEREVREAIGENSGKPPQGDLDPQCLRLFRRRLWRRIHRAARRLDRIRGQRPRYRRDHHPDQGQPKYRPCFSKISPIPA